MITEPQKRILKTIYLSGYGGREWCGFGSGLGFNKAIAFRLVSRGFLKTQQVHGQNWWLLIDEGVSLVKLAYPKLEVH